MAAAAAGGIRAAAISFPAAARPGDSKRSPAHKVAGVPRRGPAAVAARFERPLEEIYNVRVERGVPKERLEELGVQRWSSWTTGRCVLPWDWHVDQQVYVVKGEVRVVPEGGAAFGGQRYMRFVAGDLVRYPKWFEADLFFDGPYEERYRFRAYGDND